MLASALSLVLIGQSSKPFTGPTITVTFSNKKSFVIQTETSSSPKTVARISELVKQKYYDGILFHRVEDWVVQWGDPNTKKGLDTPGVGSGGTGKNMPFETSPIEFKRGIVGIASTGTKKGGDSQLFVLTKDAPHLTGNYAVLGRVSKGMEVVDAIKRGDKVVSMKLGK